MPVLSLSGIKFKSKPYSAITIIGGFPNYGVLDPPDAYAAAYGTPTIYMIPPSGISTGAANNPTLSIYVPITLAETIALVVAPSILTGTPDALSSLANASITLPIILISVSAQGTATASVTASTFSISTTSTVASATVSVTTPAIVVSITAQGAATTEINIPIPVITITSIALATASVIAPTITGTASNIIITSVPSMANASVTVPTITGTAPNQLSFPEDMIDPMWAGNLEGQSFDDIMLVQ